VGMFALPLLSGALQMQIILSVAITYSIDADDRITNWSADYSKFALMNDGLELIDGTIRGHRLWHFIADSDTRLIYRQMLDHVRKGRPLSFNFRCDGPNARRHLTMSISGAEDGAVCFTVNTVATADREYQPLLDRRFPRTEDEVPFCSWCNKICVGANMWHEVEDGVQELGLIDADRMPILDPVICEACYELRQSAI